MPIELKMPALSPTMEEGTLAKWLVKEGDVVASGDILAEIETDKATMEFEAVDEGTIARILVAEGTEKVKVGQAIAILQGEDDAVGAQPEIAASKSAAAATEATAPPPEEKGYGASPVDDAGIEAPAAAGPGERVKASPLARRVAEKAGVDLGSVEGSGPGGRVVRADVVGVSSGKPAAPEAPMAPEAKPAAPEAKVTPPATATSPGQPPIPDAPHRLTKLTSMRKVIARRLTESKQQVPHIYLTVDVRLDALLGLRAELNKALAAREVKLSVNDLLVKALAVALIEVPACNVMLAGNQLVTFERADISVAVSIPGGLITPVLTGANEKPVSQLATEMKALARSAREGKLQPHEYQGGTASISNMGMYGITQFDAVINPPQGMILAIGAGEKRPWVEDDRLIVATVMSATGSFDHRAIDGADGARLMAAFKRLVEAPLALLA
ncbi:pyruvate dehydrogenase complex dihydrolipoamide acetyltransferase [Sphingomonas sp.]|uniref:pyruvate dehydrogenase complex dihydrolipoamide acetyltransferase n=1 Tax=Sphingomonas sp. TaxID=28214 RepID=UPI003AFFA8F0